MNKGEMRKSPEHLRVFSKHFRSPLRHSSLEGIGRSRYRLPQEVSGLRFYYPTRLLPLAALHRWHRS